MNKQINISIEDLAEPLTYPVEAFISPEYAKAERELLWPKVWQMAGRLEDIPEVGNYFIWRQRDAVRNSIAMAAQAVFPHKRLHGVNSGQMQELLWSEHGINWNDYPAGCKRGRVTVRESGERSVTFVHKRTGEEETVTAMRSWWETRPAPHFTLAGDGFLATTIPTMDGLDRVA